MILIVYGKEKELFISKQYAMPRLQREAKREKEQESQAYKWRCHVRNAEAGLNRDAAEAQRLGLSYGNYIAAIYDGRIKRPEECADEL